ncbi:(6-4)DNA photolyase [Entomophthora muscae]|uniref:(6-4)DNA photolyase n=1 Tax=Entomophthora muscae TaxID=34485 RepID=A0ACC2RYJ5_9FUNG|nr:(6-4)DNA photolyase [Entomophthora muscae]
MLRLKEHDSRLFVLRGNPLKILPELVKALDAKHLTFEKDTEPYALYRDGEVMKELKDYSCDVASFTSHTLFDPESLLKPPETDYEKNIWKRGVPPLTYRAFISKALKAESNGDCVPLPIPAPTKIPSAYTSLDNLIEALGPEVAGPNGDFSVPSSEELNLELPSKEEESPHKGGETVALERMNSFLKDKARVINFKKPETAPTAFYPTASTTILSPYLKFGCLSPRLFHQELWAIEKPALKTSSKPPESLRGQLLWREFFYLCGYAVPGFDSMKQNPICLQMEWKCPQKGDSSPHLEAWREGRTGFPWIDAAMTQLRKEGWIHHLARHAVACFLTRGNLYISWERGAEVFEELLLDADWSLNSANWLWLSASAFFTQYFRVYSPIVFPKKTDPDGNYVRHWIPALKHMPPKYIYEPWTAPLDVQRRAKCIIGKDYPRPIVDHAETRKINLALMKEAYQGADYGQPNGAEIIQGKRKDRN